MRLYDIRGRLVFKNVTKYLIDWDAQSRSKLQYRVKQFLKEYWTNYLVYEEFIVYGTRLKVDFLNASKKIAIEVQGVQHNEFNKFFHQYRMNYFHSIQRDVKKAQWLEKNGFTLIELFEEDLELLSPVFFKDKFNVYIQ